ncbi:unnamed protein product [Rhizophagus irregularis]|uniref:Uncharacterized protein n=1 Tax=Rhizophagus irregularis TaxID=588596 RepID=A0A915ZS52_9GLOM|nr:unnamed protein product [Rhizophagus irregularis]
MGYEKINLKKFLKGADFSHSFPDVEVALPETRNIKLYKLLHRYPVAKTYKNQEAKYVNLTEMRNESEICCVAQQLKLTTTSNVIIDQKLFENEYKKVIKNMKEVDTKNWVLLFLTNADQKDNLSSSTICVCKR